MANNTAFKDAFTRAGILDQDAKIAIPIRKAKPNRRPTRARREQARAMRETTPAK